MIQPKKWRETIDLYGLSYKRFKLVDILGYPHAGNDVFYAKGLYDRQEAYVYIKVARQQGADLLNEVKNIEQIPFSYVPQVLEYGEGQETYLITKEAEGERLSVLVGENTSLESLSYMERYGEALAQFHQLDIKVNPVKDRRFFHAPNHEYFMKYHLEQVENYLKHHPPVGATNCFIHGDCHYANVLWKDGKVSCVLDYELSGYGIREFDLAWAVVLRPGQKFLKTFEEIEKFLEGYQRYERFSMEAFKYYYLVCASYFYGMANEQDQAFMRNLMLDFIEE